MKILLDTGILGKLCHPKKEENEPISKWLEELLKQADQLQIEVFVPEIADYELRRELIHIAYQNGVTTTRSLSRLDQLGSVLDYLPLDTLTIRRAAELWAAARARGFSTSADEALDGDVILAAQTEKVGGVVITENIRHLSQFVPAYEWQKFPPVMGKSSGYLV